MDNKSQEKKRGRWELVFLLLAMLLSFFCVFTATAMAMMSQPDRLDKASMLPVGTANYSRLDSEKTKFGQLDEGIFADATQDSAGLHLTPNSSGEASGRRETPIFIAFVTPDSSETLVPAPVVVTMDAPGTAVPPQISTLPPTATKQPTRTPRNTATATVTSTRTRLATGTATQTPWPTVTSSSTPFPTAVPSQTPVPAQPTATSRPSNPPTSTPRPNPSQTPVPTTAVTNTPSPTSSATNTPIPSSTPIPSYTPTQIPPTVTNTPVATTVPTLTPTATATATPRSAQVLSIALVNADTNAIIPGYETMPDGIVLDLATLPTENLNMWVSLNPMIVHHVDVSLRGAATIDHTEEFYPYTFPGNNNFDFYGYNFVVGTYTLTFRPYLDAVTQGIPFVFNFAVIRSTAPPPIPTDTPTPTNTPVSGMSLVPVVCVNDNGGGWFTARFGYQNDNSFTITLPVGANNRFSPAPEHRGQPEKFIPGGESVVVITNFNAPESVSWILDGNTAVADSSSPVCP